MAVLPRTLAAVIRPAQDGDDIESVERRAALVSQMSDALVRAQPRTASHALGILRQAFSDYPLALRLAALAAAMKDIGR